MTLEDIIASARAPSDESNTETPARAERPASPAEAVFEKGARSSACPFAEELSAAGRASGLDPRLVISVAQAETRCRHVGQRSAKGAIGLMQLMPATARRFGAIDPWRIDENIAAGVAYLAWLSQRYGGDCARVVAAYNAGESAVDRHGGTPPFAETRVYVATIMAQLTDGSGPPVCRLSAEVSAGRGDASAATPLVRRVTSDPVHARVEPRFVLEFGDPHQDPH